MGSKRTVIAFLAICILVGTTLAQTASTPDDFDSLIAEAATLVKAGKYKEAIAAANKASALRPTEARPYAFMGIGEYALDKFTEASSSFASAIKYAPAEPLFYFYKADADRLRNANAEGLIAIRKCIELKPNYSDAYLVLGDLLSNPDERQAAFRKALEFDPKIVEVYYFYAVRLENVKKNDKAAEAAYRLTMEMDPKKMVGRFALGRLLVRQRRLTEARKIWDERTSDQDNVFPHFITILVRAENLEKASKAYAASPDDPEALVQMGFATMDGDSWVVDDRWEKAIVYFKKALEIKPDLAKAQYGLCKAYVEMADVKGKEINRTLDQELEKLRRLDPKLADDIVEYRRTYPQFRLQALPPPAKSNFLFS